MRKLVMKENVFLIKCEVCGYTFSSLRNLKTHMRTKHVWKYIWKSWLYCEKCKNEFWPIRKLNEHIENVHNEENIWVVKWKSWF